MSGFTIIEVMLFLAVTGALTVGILASSGVAINEQRYRDTLTGVQSKLQQQYNQVAHVINSRNTGAGVSECVGGSERRGASNCIVIGRLLRIARDDITMTPLVAKPVTDVLPENSIPDQLEDSVTDDFTTEQLFGLYGLHSADELTEIYKVPWSAHTDLETDRELRVLILRSPATGLIHTYSAMVDKDSGMAPESLGPIVNTSNSVERRICIPREGLGSAQDLGIVLRENAASAAAVELMTDSSPCDS